CSLTLCAARAKECSQPKSVKTRCSRRDLPRMLTPSRPGSGRRYEWPALLQMASRTSTRPKIVHHFSVFFCDCAASHPWHATPGSAAPVLRPPIPASCCYPTCASLPPTTPPPHRLSWNRQPRGQYPKCFAPAPSSPVVGATARSIPAPLG